MEAYVAYLDLLYRADINRLIHQSEIFAIFSNNFSAQNNTTSLFLNINHLYIR